METFEEIAAALIRGDAETARALTEQLLADGTEPVTILNKGLLPGMGVVAERFKKNELFIPEVLVAARAMQFGLNVLEPLLAKSGVPYRGTVMLGTVKGDIHDIGKNIVRMMLKGAGFRIIDLGVDVWPDQFVKAVQEHRPNVLGLSALLSTTMPALKLTIDALKTNGVRDSLKVIVGGAPVTREYAESIGADGYAKNGGSAVEEVERLMALR
jgi:5-methyltetrahydrofolate--homocysteine methyltransferase